LRAALAVATAAAWTLALPVAASAELVTFATGRTMSVKAARQDGASLVLTLRNGGEMVLDAALISSIGPDEVPYPDPIEPVVENVIQPAPSVEALVEDSRFDPIRRLAAEKGVDATLVRAVIQVESAYQPRARSSRGAVGLMQVMPSTARQYGITNLYDPSSNIRAGVTHLKSLLDRFPLALALAAYNAGEAAVARFAGVPPYPETIDYVSRIRSLVGR
jgi:hypothetical protein